MLLGVSDQGSEDSISTCKELSLLLGMANCFSQEPAENSMKAVLEARAGSCQKQKSPQRCNRAELSLPGHQDLRGQVAGIQKGSGIGDRHEVIGF